VQSPLSAPALELFLHQQIPLSQAMQVAVVEVTEDAVLLSAPLAPNLNHRATPSGRASNACSSAGAGRGSQSLRRSTTAAAQPVISAAILSRSITVNTLLQQHQEAKCIKADWLVLSSTARPRI
jgi:Putative thioesterase (yiiD_Cterm)